MAAEQLLCGAQSIADAVGLPRRRIYTLIETGVLPAFKLGGQICASPSALERWRAAKLVPVPRKKARAA